jgi:hypothetical protein
VSGLSPRKLHSPWRRKLQRAVLRAWRAAKGPLVVSHHLSASAANFAASRLSNELLLLLLLGVGLLLLLAGGAAAESVCMHCCRCWWC